MVEGEKEGRREREGGKEKECRCWGCDSIVVCKAHSRNDRWNGTNYIREHLGPRVGERDALEVTNLIKSFEQYGFCSCSLGFV